MTGRPLPASRLLGRAAGRWWRRIGPAVAAVSRPARARWAGAVAWAWLAGFLWVGLLLAAGAANLADGGSSTASAVVAIGGGVVLGAWQARHRLRRHRVPGTPPLRGVGVALVVWLGLLALAVRLEG